MSDAPSARARGSHCECRCSAAFSDAVGCASIFHTATYEQGLGLGQGMHATTRLAGRQTPLRGGKARAVLFPAFVLALVIVAYFAQAPPDALSAGAPVTSFSAERALRHVRAIAT
jgi:hypothetical protein